MTDKSLVKRIVRFLEDKPVRVYRHYSGRGMYGRRCIGFVGDRSDCEGLGYRIKRKTGAPFSVDNMGLDFIVYFPSISDEYKQ
jgi:tRNA(Ile2) C34 agmatinyltransferase TiaS